MASARTSKKRRVLDRLNELCPERIGEAEFRALRQEFAPISENWARKVVRDCGFPLAPMVEGVRQDTMEALDRTLLSLLGEYEQAEREGNRERTRQVRRLVILAKDHAKLAARTAGPEKQEMVLRMLTWLENPGIFRQWLSLRNARR